jgi:HAE1 family hydrophobic/amphiphilic exporter-1
MKGLGYVRLFPVMVACVVLAISGAAQTISPTDERLQSASPQTQSTAAPNQSQQPASNEVLLVLPRRTGIATDVPISLEDVIQQVLANNKDIAVTHLDVQRARFNVQAARGAYDPVIGGQATYQDEVSPVSSFLGGSTSGSVTQKTFNFVPRVSGAIPGFGSSYAVDFSSQRVTSNSQFLSLNPQFPTALSFGFTQPLLRNFSIDVAREQIEVATKNQNLSAEQLRQQLIVTLSQAEQAYWQLRFAKDNLDVRVQGLQLAREQAGSNERRANAGTLAPVDVVEAQTQVATAEQSVYQAQQTLTAAENTLKSLMLPDRLSALVVEWTCSDQRLRRECSDNTTGSGNCGGIE